MPDVAALDYDDEAAKVRKWRQGQLEKAGLSEFTSFRIAMRFDVPYQKAVHLLQLGMTEHQIVDQLLEEES